jgi:ATP-dependent DNA helicase PIF1
MLDNKQQEVIDLLKQGKNVFMTSNAGCGKSYCIEHIKDEISTKIVHITSTTGISALNINGSTLHSFLGIGLGEGTVEELIKKINYNKKVRERLLIKDILIVIDEISMLSNNLLDKIDLVLKRLRHSNSPFGGIQMLFSGDLLQLSPINEAGILENEIFKNSFTTVILKTNYRQGTDQKYQDILNNLRINKLTEENIEELEKRNNIDIKNLDYTKIFSTNKEINIVNKKCFDKLKTKSVTFNAKYYGKPEYVRDLKKQFEKKDIDILVLKTGLKVMLTRNISPETGLVNGSIGIITHFDTFTNSPIVKFENGIESTIIKFSHEIVCGNVAAASATQIPLIIAYAFTTHKIQGNTLDSAIIDCSRVFCEHQMYVMLSRVKTLDKLYLINFSVDKIKVNNEIVEFYGKLSHD